MSEYMSTWYDFTIYDWTKPEENTEFIQNWHSFDIILGNSAITFSGVEGNYVKEMPTSILNKMLVTVHANLISSDRFNEKIPAYAMDNAMWTGVSEEVVSSISNKYNISADVLPNFVDTNIFKEREQNDLLENILIAGMVGNGFNEIAEWQEVKRPQMFVDICKKANIKYKFIHGYPIEAGSKIYEEIDLLIVPSISEGFALPIIEAAACGIPVISTEVGVSRHLRNIQTFKTVDEAVCIINKFKADRQYLRNYTTYLRNEVRNYWNIEYICERYWKPLLEKRLKNKDI